MSFYLDLFAFSLIDMSLWKKKNLKSIFQTYEIKDFSTLNQKLIIFHKIKIMWGWWFIHFTTFFFQFCCLVHIFLDILGQRLLSESLIKKPWLLLIVMFPPLSIYLVGFYESEYESVKFQYQTICRMCCVWGHHENSI